MRIIFPVLCHFVDFSSGSAYRHKAFSVIVIVFVYPGSARVLSSGSPLWGSQHPFTCEMIDGVAFTRIHTKKKQEYYRSTQYFIYLHVQGILINFVPPLYISTISTLDWQAMTSMDARTSRSKSS